MVSSQPCANVLTVVLPNLLCWIEHQDGRVSRKQDPSSLPRAIEYNADGQNENLKNMAFFLAWFESAGMRGDRGRLRSSNKRENVALCFFTPKSTWLICCWPSGLSPYQASKLSPFWLDRECRKLWQAFLLRHPPISMKFGCDLATDIFVGTIWRRGIKALVYIKHCQHTWFLIKLIEYNVLKFSSFVEFLAF